MIDKAGIHDGDTMIIGRCNSPENGDIVVALVEKEEATLEASAQKGSTIALEAANPEFKTRIFGPDQVDIQGRLVGLLRRYWGIAIGSGQLPAAYCPPSSSSPSSPSSTSGRGGRG